MSFLRAARTLRIQLISIVVLTVAAVLTLSQWVDTRLSERALEQDMRERALLALRAVGSLWGATNAAELHTELAAIIQGDREIVAISTFRLKDGAMVPDVRASEANATAASTLTEHDIAVLNARGVVMRSAQAPDGTERLRITVPLRVDGQIVGAAQVELVAAAIVRLKRYLQTIYGGALFASIILISVVLSFFLERQVARPLAALVDGMRRAEHGERGVRVQPRTGGDFGFLTGNFNRMLSRIEDLTAGLEQRVRVATQDLADKNRELSIANEKLWQAQLDVGRSERLATLGQMAGTLAHELGTPLNSVLGYVQLLRREEHQPERADKLEVIESQVQRMVDTIRSVLDRTRDMPVQRTPVPIRPLVSEALAVLSTQLMARHIVPLVDLPTGLPPVPGDAIGLRQVLVNLLTNAIDATDANGAIAISACVAPLNGDRSHSVEIAVRDNGHGMSPEEVRRVFEPFYTTKAPGRGTGLGLVIVDHIIRAHGGHLVVDSIPGQGTVMRVHLPLEAQ
jgi:two-component system, NtrC family, sensor kinase